MDLQISLINLSIVILLVMFLTPPLFMTWLYFKNRGQKQHSLLRGRYWYVGILRYMIENVGPEFRFYITDEDNSGKPISRTKFVSIVKASKYLKTLISFGSKRDFTAPGLFIKNTMFPLLKKELSVDNSLTLKTQRYITEKETIFFRHEKVGGVNVQPWYLTEDNIVTVGEKRANPWRLKGLIGMSAMSYGALGPNAITALSKGIGMAGGAWMNTGEGGLSDYHLTGGCDIIFQLGPGLFGVRNDNGDIDWDKLKRAAAIPQVKAVELKMGQGAKIRGGHVEGAKVTPEIAAIRGVEPWKNIDSPNRFEMFHGISGLFDFIEEIQAQTGLPVGVKIVMGDSDSLDELCDEYVKRGGGPDFITIDGGEGGTGATFKEMADSMGLPIYSAITLADNALRKAGVRDKVKIISAGRLHLPDEIAMALGLGADLVAIARGFMISAGCIMTEKCHTNECPVGVATTNPETQRALYVDEKKYRIMNYIITLRAGLFSLCAACGISSPTQLERKHLVYKDAKYGVTNCSELFPYPK